MLDSMPRRREMAETVIGPRTKVQGALEGADRLVVRGLVKGTVSVDGPVLVAPGGTLEAEVAAVEVAIAGAVVGRVTARGRVEILPAARMVGDVRTPRILISDGAVFRGKVDMDFADGEGATHG